MKFKILSTFLLILLLNVAVYAQGKVALPPPSQTEFGQDILPQTVFLKIPPNGNSANIDIGLSVYIGKYTDKVDPNSKLKLFEAYGARGLLNIQTDVLQIFLEKQVSKGKITEEEAKGLLNSLIETHKQLLATTDKLIDTLIKAEYPFEPALTAIPKPK